jgi:hypothetical protein
MPFPIILSHQHWQLYRLEDHYFGNRIFDLGLEDERVKVCLNVYSTNETQAMIHAFVVLTLGVGIFNEIVTK